MLEITKRFGSARQAVAFGILGEIEGDLQRCFDARHHRLVKFPQLVLETSLAYGPYLLAHNNGVESQSTDSGGDFHVARINLLFVGSVGDGANDYHRAESVKSVAANHDHRSGPTLFRTFRRFEVSHEHFTAKRHRRVLPPGKLPLGRGLPNRCARTPPPRVEPLFDSPHPPPYTRIGRRFADAYTSAD